MQSNIDILTRGQNIDAAIRTSGVFTLFPADGGEIFFFVIQGPPPAIVKATAADPAKLQCLRAYLRHVSKL